MSGWRRWLRLTTSVVLLVLVYFLLPISRDLSRSDAIQLAGSLVALALLALLVLWEVRRQLADANRHIDGLVLALVVSILGFALGFYAMDRHNPDQIAGLETRIDALYFTMTTTLTVGFGDIHAVGQGARAMVLAQMVFNTVILTTAVTTLTSRIRARAVVAVETRRQDRDTQRKPT